MSMAMMTEPSQQSETAARREAWNRCRFRRGMHTGHYESFYQRANHPTRPLGFWIRYTIFSPKGRPADAIGELWAVWFDGENNRVIATKEEHPIADCEFNESGIGARISHATLDDHSLQGHALRNDHRIEWDLSYGGAQPPLLMFPEALYAKPLPKAKSLVGSPNALFNGAITVDGERHELNDWRGSQNHNWGSKHTDYYAFGQVAGFENAPESFLECSTAQLKIGPLWTPRMTLLVLRHEGKEYRLNTIGQALRGKASIAYFNWSYTSRTPEVEISARFQAPRSHFVGLTYYNPPGGAKTCLNCKIANVELTLRRHGADPVTLRSGPRALFEILTDDDRHGVPILT
jgi:hypothetical protein